VAGNIGDLPACAALIESIVTGARARLQALGVDNPSGIAEPPQELAHGV
jgi:hypothetical protein